MLHFVHTHSHKSSLYTIVPRFKGFSVLHYFSCSHFFYIIYDYYYVLVTSRLFALRKSVVCMFGLWGKWEKGKTGRTSWLLSLGCEAAAISINFCFAHCWWCLPTSFATSVRKIERKTPPTKVGKLWAWLGLKSGWKISINGGTLSTWKWGWDWMQHCKAIKMQIEMVGYYFWG